jgi:hypothetical protein
LKKFAIADCKRRPKSFKVGDKMMVYLRKERLPLDIKGKLRQRKYGPFSILRRINDNAYMIDLPAEIGISNTFNVADLTIYHPEEALYEDNSRSSSKQPREDDGEQQGKKKKQKSSTILTSTEFYSILHNLVL